MTEYVFIASKNQDQRTEVLGVFRTQEAGKAFVERIIVGQQWNHTVDSPDDDDTPQVWKNGAGDLIQIDRWELSE